MAAGYNSSRYPHITNTILYRWIYDLSIRIPTYGVEDFEIIPAKFERFPGLAFEVIVSKNGGALPKNEDLLAPGDYAIFRASCKHAIFNLQTHDSITAFRPE